VSEENLDPDIFKLRRLAAMQAWYENMPVRKGLFPLLSGTTAFRRLDYGRLARLHVLDTRSHRSDQACDDGKLKPCVPEARTSGTVLGAKQEAWLDEGLGNSATWNLIAQQLLFQPLDLRKQGDSHPLLATDAWDGYRGARDRLVDSIRRHGLSNVIIVSGDYHRNVVGEVPVRDTDPAGAKAAVEFLATSITSESPKALEPMEFIQRTNPHLKLFDDERGYHLHEFTRRQLTTQVKSVADTKTRGAGVSDIKRFVVTPDSPTLQRA
jgi:alkaline phosphatase D